MRPNLSCPRASGQRSAAACAARLFPLLPLAIAVGGCASVRAIARSPRTPDQLRADVVHTARAWLGERRLSLRGRPLPADCWSLPVAAYGRNGMALGGADAEGLYRAARDLGRLLRSRQPQPGDLVFVADAQGGRNLHVGLVAEVETDGTVTVYQRMARGIVAYRMNARHPDEPTSPGSGRRWNDSFASRSGPPKLAGQLFHGYAAFLP